MLIKGTQTPTTEFSNLINHTIKLLAYSEEGFKKNQKNYALYLAFLITNNDFETSVQGVEKRIQLLLMEPHKFWLSHLLENATPNEINLKRQVIKYIILNELELVITKNLALNTLIPQINEFIKLHKNNFHEKFKDNETAITKIFLENMDFVLPRERDTDHTDLIISIGTSLGSFLLGCYSTFHPAWNYVSHSLNVYNLDYKDLPHSYVKFINRIVAEMIIFGGLAAGFIAYKSVNYFIRLMHDKNKRSWNSLSYAQFIDYCKKDKELAQLVANEEGIDKFWLRQSPISHNLDITILRAYIHTELSRLAPDLEVKELYKLLTCAVMDTPPALSDLSYPIPIDAIRKPLNAWPVTGDAHPNIVPLLQNYIKLATIEFMKSESKEIPKFTKAQLEQWNFLLINKIAQIKATIEEIETPTFNSLIRISLHMSLAATLVSLSAFLYNFRYSLSLINMREDPSKEEAAKIILTALIGGMFSSPTTAAMTAVGIYKLLSKIHRKYQDYSELRSANTLFFYTEKTMKRFPVLKEIFAEEKDVEEQEENKKFKIN